MLDVKSAVTGELAAAVSAFCSCLQHSSGMQQWVQDGDSSKKASLLISSGKRWSMSSSIETGFVCD